MFKNLLELFKNNSVESTNVNDKEHSIQIAACALLLDLATVDESFTKEEKEKIIRIMKSKFSLLDSEINSLILESEEEINNSVSVYEFTEVINQHFTNDEKYCLVKNLWQIAFTDGNIDKYEDHYIKKISNNLHLSHKDRIAAKLEVKEKLNL